MKFLFAILLALALAGCATTGSYDIATDPDTVVKLKDVAIKDLTEAAASATAHNDVVAAQCWNGLIPVASQIQDFFKPVKLPALDKVVKSAGPFSTYQNLRNLKAQINSDVDVLLALAQAGKLKQIKQAINMACAALKEDAKTSVVDPLGIVSGQQAK
jgi:hypothetical protein